MHKLQIVDHFSNEILFEEHCSCNSISALLDSCLKEDIILVAKDGVKLLKMEYVTYSIMKKENIKVYKVRLKEAMPV